MEYINKKLIEFNNYLVGRKVAIIGLGVSNIPLIDYLYNLKSDVTVFDEKEIDDIDKRAINKIFDYNMKYFFGKFEKFCINISFTKLLTNKARTCC